MPINPVITQPIVGVMLKRCVTVDASSNLSCSSLSDRCSANVSLTLNTYGDLSLGNHDGCIFAPDCYCSVSGACDSLERIFWTRKSGL